MPDAAYRYGKRIDVPYTSEEGETRLYSLSHRQTTALITLAKTLAWKTRYVELPEGSDIEEFADRTQRDLMMALDFCAEVAECIELNETVKEKLRDLIQQTVSPNNNQPGDPLPDSEIFRDLAAGSNPGCNKDILFAQCKTVIIYTNRIIVDTLEKVEVTSNIVELVTSLSQAIPGFAALVQAAGATGIAEMISYYQNAIAEQYNAQYTQLLEDELSCELFCLCENDCIVNIDRIVSVIEARLSAYLDISNIEDTLSDFIQFLAGVSQDDTFVVELAYYACWGMAKIGNFFFGRVLDRSLEIMLNMVTDEPDNDWQTLCDDCAPQPGVLEIYIDPDYPQVPYGTIEFVSAGNYVLTAQQWSVDGYYRVAVGSPNGASANYVWTGAAAPVGTIFAGYWNTGNTVRQTGDTPDGTSGRYRIYHISTLPFTLNINVVEA